MFGVRQVGKKECMDEVSEGVHQIYTGTNNIHRDGGGLENNYDVFTIRS